MLSVLYTELVVYYGTKNYVKRVISTLFKNALRVFTEYSYCAIYIVSQNFIQSCQSSQITNIILLLCQCHQIVLCDKRLGLGSSSFK